ncbi:MAG: NYN domain-containing protein [Chloroflexi bacterium]|nr:NYN domain-containing protein [Chloroflexota bacterium]
MPYLIDGHNLIPHVPGLSLQQPDDEMRLLSWLKEFCRHTRKQAEVYFDQAPPGFPAQQRFGLVEAHFVRQGMTADEAIRQRLVRLGKNARNWTVVSSDRQVQAEARQARAQVIASEDFAAQMQAISAGKPAGHRREDSALSPEELQEWLDLFSKRPPGRK